MHFIISKEDFSHMRYDAIDRLVDAKMSELSEIFTHDIVFIDIVRVLVSCVINAGFYSGSFVNLSDTVDQKITQLGVTDENQVNTLSWVFNETFVTLKNLLSTSYVEGNLYSVDIITDRFSGEVNGLDVRMVLPVETVRLYEDIIPIRKLAEAVLPGESK